MGASTDQAAHISFADGLKFWLENYVSQNQKNKFYLLLWFTLGCILVHAALFSRATGQSYKAALYVNIQTIATGGYDESLQEDYARMIFISAMLVGIVVFAVLVGFMNEMVMSTMHALSEGKTKVACENHTLLLGWNECTVRVVCQLSFLRRQYLITNETCMRKMCPWKRVAPSTPVAAAKIVIMCNTMKKEDMDFTLREALLERGILPSRTCVGKDVICRVGDPTEPHDLLRVGAHRATAVLTMMTEGDEAEEEASGGYIKNGVTLKTVLALKNAIMTHNADGAKYWDNFRCVLHLNMESKTIAAAQDWRIETSAGYPLVRSINLQPLVTATMFASATNPALPEVMLQLVNFDGVAFRARDATDLGLVGYKVQDCALIWENAVFCGVVDKSRCISASHPEPNEGLACNPHRVITANDRVIFISERNFPTLCGLPKDEPRFLGRVGKEKQRTIDTLICGWRKLWSTDPQRFKDRVNMLINSAAAGSNIMFLNMYEPAQFEAIMTGYAKKIKQYRNGALWENQGVRLHHVHGDPGDADVLKQVMDPCSERWQADSDKRFEVVIVLGTSAKALPKRSQETRMLSTYVLVHQLHSELYGDARLHVITENNFDTTQALAQAVTLKDSIKDLVNSQAMFARGLVQALAFPLMQPAVAQLFNDVPGNPGLRLFRVGYSLIPPGPATFRDVTRTISEHHEMRGAICLGVVFQGNKQGKSLAPHPDEEYDFAAGDMLVVIDRGMAGVNQYHQPDRDWSETLESEDEEQSTAQSSTRSEMQSLVSGRTRLSGRSSHYY